MKWPDERDRSAGSESWRRSLPPVEVGMRVAVAAGLMVVALVAAVRRRAVARPARCAPRRERSAEAAPGLNLRPASHI